MLMKCKPEDCDFTQNHGVLDGKLKQLNRTGNIEKKSVDLISTEMEEKLRESGLLVTTPHKSLLIHYYYVYLNGLNFALKSGEEHQ